jgi:hypothetical protein
LPVETLALSFIDHARHLFPSARTRCLAFAPRASRRDFFQTPDSVTAVFEGALESGAAGGQKSMPPPMPRPDIAGAAFSGVSATIASVVMRSAAIEAAPCRARRMTLVGSMMPAFTMST